MISVFYRKGGMVELLVARKLTASAWGIERTPWNIEVWAGNLYVCASFRQARVERAVRRLKIAGLAMGCYTLGWMMPSPLSPSYADPHEVASVFPCELIVNREYAPRH